MAEQLSASAQLSVSAPLSTPESYSAPEQRSVPEQLSASEQEVQGLTAQELQSLQILAFFFYQTGAPQSAKRAVKSILALAPKNLWARGLAVLCENSLENYERVLALTEAENLEDFASEAAWQRSLLLLRARALEKTARHDEALVLLAKVTAS